MAEAVIIQFPGVNCEYETLRALEAAGIKTRILRWNEELKAIRSAASVILPGGFSYQDRIRAGAVAARDRVIDEVFEAAVKGTPVLGVCNGAQILVESGIVPGFDKGAVSVALALNKMSDRAGYYCNWIRLKKGPADCVFTSFLDEWELDCQTMPCPIAHAEGRFTTASSEVERMLKSGKNVALYYASADGTPADKFPQNPNGSIAGIAGLTNSGGNVMAIMPHPERAAWLYQVPAAVGGYWGKKRLNSEADLHGPGPGSGVFDSLKRALV